MTETKINIDEIFDNGSKPIGNRNFITTSNTRYTNTNIAITNCFPLVFNFSLRNIVWLNSLLNLLNPSIINLHI
jgi:hypothetical protein